MKSSMPCAIVRLLQSVTQLCIAQMIGLMMLNMQMIVVMFVMLMIVLIVIVSPDFSTTVLIVLDPHESASSHLVITCD
jgi:hypothetical protein